MPVASSTATDLLIALTGKRLAKLHLAARVLTRWSAPTDILFVEVANWNAFMCSNDAFIYDERADSLQSPNSRCLAVLGSMLSSTPCPALPVEWHLPNTLPDTIIRPKCLRSVIDGKQYLADRLKVHPLTI